MFITIERDPPMIVFRPPLLELVTGTTLIAVGMAQALTETVPAPAGDPLVALLTALGVGGIISWSVKQLLSWHIKRMEADRAALWKRQEDERAQDKEERDHQREQNKQLQEQIAEMVKHHQDEAKFWRERYLAEHGDP